jgi:rhamnosyltransferase
MKIFLSNQRAIMHSLERIYPFAAQQAGFYSAWVMTLSYSQLEITNYHKITKDYHIAFAGKIGFEGREYYLNLINQGDQLNQQMLAESALKERAKKLILKIAGLRGLNKASSAWRKIK